MNCVQKLSAFSFKRNSAIQCVQLLRLFIVFSYQVCSGVHCTIYLVCFYIQCAKLPSVPYWPTCLPILLFHLFNEFRYTECSNIMVLNSPVSHLSSMIGHPVFSAIECDQLSSVLSSSMCLPISFSQSDIQRAQTRYIVLSYPDKSYL